MKRTHLAMGMWMLTVLACAGCNIVGPAYYLVHGPEKVKKSFTLDKKKSTVVFIDDRANHVPRRALRVIMGEEAEKTLLKERVVQDMITAQSAMTAAGSDRDGKPMSVTEVGESVKAQIVIYATIDAFFLTGDGTTLSPTIDMRVRVIDVASDTRLWPEDPKGKFIRSRLIARADPMPTDTTGRYKIEDELAKLAGLEIAQLFYDHEPIRGPKVPD